MTKLTSSDPEPGLGAEVRDAYGRLWTHVLAARGFDGYWVGSEQLEDGEPESWYKVAGNYGPVELISEGAW